MTTASPSSTARLRGLEKQWITGILGWYDFRSGAHRESHLKLTFLKRADFACRPRYRANRSGAIRRQESDTRCDKQPLETSN
jgi:hypothetical protein